MLKTIVTLVAAVATLAAAAIAPVDYIAALRDNPIGAGIAMFLAWTSALYIGYVLGNIASGLIGQGDAGRAPALYWIDYVPSWLAWFSFNLVGLWVLLGILGIVHGFAPITKVADVPNSYWVLLGLVLFSWIDVGILQGHKHKAALQYIRTQRAYVPPPIAVQPAPVVPPAGAVPAPVAVPIAVPVHVGKTMFIAFLVFAVLILLAIVFGRTGEDRHASVDKGGCTLTVASSVMKGGTRFDTVVPNCD